MTQILPEVRNEGTDTVTMKKWMGENTVARFVWDEVKQRVVLMSPEGAAAPVRMNRRGEILLAILTYAYVRGIFRSREIEEELMRSPVAQRFFSNAPITAATLRCFRARNRPLVRDCVFQVMWRTLRAKGNRATAVIGCPAGEGELPAVLSNTVCFRLASSEAEQRVNEAAIRDQIDRE